MISIVSLSNGQYLVGKGAKTYLTKPHSHLPSWYTPDFFLESTLPWHTHESYAIVDELKFPKQVLQLGEPECLDAMFRSMNLLKGVVYTRCPVYNFNPYSVLSHLSGKHLIYATEGIVGATPELLFTLSPKGLETMALAATADNERDLQREKEQEEHQIVVEAIQKALEPYGRITLGPQVTSPYGKLFHLKTPISLEGSLTFQQAVEALHPTPAVGAWPLKEGKKWLREQDRRLPRYRYGAPFGYSLPERQEARALVAIRCIQWNAEEAYLYAGAGITAQSIYEDECQEIKNKMAATANLMGISTF